MFLYRKEIFLHVQNRCSTSSICICDFNSELNITEDMKARMEIVSIYADLVFYSIFIELFFDISSILLNKFSSNILNCSSPSLLTKLYIIENTVSTMRQNIDLLKPLVLNKEYS